MSLRDLPLLKDIIGGSVNIFFNKGWFCISCQCFIKISFKLRTDGWYCVTNSKILLFALDLSWSIFIVETKDFFKNIFYIYIFVLCLSGLYPHFWGVNSRRFIVFVSSLFLVLEQYCGSSLSLSWSHNSNWYTFTSLTFVSSDVSTWELTSKYDVTLKSDTKLTGLLLCYILVKVYPLNHRFLY